ncbi:MAG TPA: TonB-dependent receptor, partial [Acidobacteriota bacterium]|nr:TonB-dependent receptor [Acidobacteriota bacterium]
ISTRDFSGAFPIVTLGTEYGNDVPASIGPSVLAEISVADRRMFENLYNDLLGNVESVNRTYHSDLTSPLPAGSGRERDFAQINFSAFIQNNWRIFRNFTLNLGLRYELSTVPKELNGFQSVLDKAGNIGDSATISDFKIVAGDNWYGKNLRNFAPRAGFAWDVFETGSTILRGSYGLYYDHPSGATSEFIDGNSYGFSQNVALHPNASGGGAHRLSDGIALPAHPGVPDSQPEATRAASIAIMDPNFTTPRVHQFHLTIERRLWGAIWEAGYTGTRGKKLFHYLNLNQTKTDGNFLQSFMELQSYREMGTPVHESNTITRVFGTPLDAFNALGGSNFDLGRAGAAADIMDRQYFDLYAAAGVSDFYLRRFPQFNMFLFGANAAESWYDSLRLGIRKSARNYNMRAWYTWSKSLDNASTDGLAHALPSNSFNLAFDKAPSNFDRTHVFNFAFNYALPFGRTLYSDWDQPLWFNSLLGGWNIGILSIWKSGARFSVNSGVENSYAGIQSLANFDGDIDPGRLIRFFGRIDWFSDDAIDQFSYPGAGELATSTRNFFTGPRYFNLDLMLHKRFPVRRDQSIQLRIELYNALNNARFAPPNNNLSDPNFGVITSTVGNPRIMQLGLRYEF